MDKLKIKSELLPKRCEICHQADYFDPQTNYCSRCEFEISSKDLIKKGPKLFQKRLIKKNWLDIKIKLLIAFIIALFFLTFSRLYSTDYSFLLNSDEIVIFISNILSIKRLYAAIIMQFLFVTTGIVALINIIQISKQYKIGLNKDLLNITRFVAIILIAYNSLILFSLILALSRI
jgi:hypothetical protein